MMKPILWLRRSLGFSTVRRGVWDDNPIYRQILGICSALAVTNLLVNTAVMSAGLVFVTAMSSFTVSCLRNVTPKRVRMMGQVLIIASYVIMVDITIKAYLPDISEALGPYVGLIITNCIIMGRCEGFASKNPPLLSFLDGVGCGLGYSLVLLSIAFARELLGFGTLFGVAVLPDDATRWIIMVMPPGAFFMLGLVMWLLRAVQGAQPPAEGG
ncbi:MAG: Rnf-Nqr domain containing protein [Deferrisomatales bacterium]|nr:Rnf-Nqr domain containing protein [Deferrisomatales bacterium]